MFSPYGSMCSASVKEIQDVESPLSMKQQINDAHRSIGSREDCLMVGVGVATAGGGL